MMGGARRLAISWILLFVFTPSSAAWAEPLVIATISDSATSQVDADERVRAEIKALLEPEFSPVFPEDLRFDARGKSDQARRHLSAAYATRSVDVVLMLGPLSSQIVAERAEFPRPTIASFVIDPTLQGFPLTDDGTSGRRNLTYNANASRIDRLFGELLKLVDVKHLAVIVEPELLRSAPGLVSGLVEAGDPLGLEVSTAPWGDSLDDVVGLIPSEVDAVVAGPLAGFSDDDVRGFAEDLAREGLPSLALGGIRDVERGLLASYEAADNELRLGRRIALQVQAVALGGGLASWPVFHEERRELVLNVQTAQRIRVSPRYDAIASAILVGDVLAGAEASGKLTLRAAVEASVERNLDLRSETRVVAAGREDVILALAALLPQASFESRARWIDDDRAFAGNPERRVTAGVSLQQLIFDEEAIGEFSATENTQRSLEATREEVRQDVMQATAIAFVDVLIASTTARIQRDNLRVTRANLDLASTRRRIGAGEVSEVYRWQSEEADAQRDLIDAEFALLNARFELNRILDRNIERQQAIAGVTLGEIGHTIVHPRVRPLLESPLGLQRLRDFAARSALRVAPELRSLDAQIAAERRRLASRRRDFFLPDLSFDASLDQIVDDGGAAASTDPANETEWTVGVSASIPLAEGGGRAAEVRQARENLSRLRVDRRNEVRSVDERVRRAVNEASSSFIAIDLTRRSADASKLRLKIVTEQYKRGAIGIIDLLDAQNAAFTAEQNAANSTFEHMIDLFELQRAMGEFELFQTDEEQAARIVRLESFLETEGAAREEDR